MQGKLVVPLQTEKVRQKRVSDIVSCVIYVYTYVCMYGARKRRVTGHMATGHATTIAMFGASTIEWRTHFRDNVRITHFNVI